MDAKANKHHYLSVQLKGDSLNINGLGAWIELHYNGHQQVYEQTPYRGYLFTIQLALHFGLNNVTVVDSVIVKWPDGKKQALQNVATNQTVKIGKTAANQSYSWQQPVLAQNVLFTDVSTEKGIAYMHFQKDYIDFNIQKLLPHKFSDLICLLPAGWIRGIIQNLFPVLFIETILKTAG